MLQTNVKSFGEIISAFSPQNELPFLLLTRRRMDPAGFEPASATWTESYVPITPRALVASIRMTLNAGKGASHTSGKPVPNWEAAHRPIGQQALAPTPNDEDRRLSPQLLEEQADGLNPAIEVRNMELLIRRAQVAVGEAEAHHHAGDLQRTIGRPMRLSVRVLFACNSVFRSSGCAGSASSGNDPLLTCSLDGRTVYGQLQRPRAKALGVEREK
jgi:hypothetical protein